MEIVTSRQGQKDLSSLHTDMLREDGFIAPSLEIMQESFEQGLAAVWMERETAIGFVMLKDLVDTETREILGVDEKFPSLLTPDAAFINPLHRGKRLYPELRAHLFREQHEEVETNRSLILGSTLKTSPFDLMDRMEAEGMNFSVARPMEIPLLAMFNPLARVEIRAGTYLNSLTPDKCDLYIIKQPDGTLKMGVSWEDPFYIDRAARVRMYFSSIELARQANIQLAQRFSSVRDFMKALWEVKYFGDDRAFFEYHW